jgi:hypothetical protein
MNEHNSRTWLDTGNKYWLQWCYGIGVELLLYFFEKYVAKHHKRRLLVIKANKIYVFQAFSQLWKLLSPFTSQNIE